MRKSNHAIGDVFFEPVACQGPVAAFPRNDGRHTTRFQPVKKPTKLRPKDSGVRQPSEKCFNGIKDNPLCPNGINGILPPDG
jgi:hypothetical protein